MDTWLFHLSGAMCGKTICLATRIDPTMVYGSDQFSADLSSGIKEAIHAMNSLFLHIITLILAGVCLWLMHQMYLTH